jgi:hypothetical protein
MFFIAFIGYGIFYLFKGLIEKELHYIKKSIYCFGIALVCLIMPLLSIVGEIADAFRN